MKFCTSMKFYIPKILVLAGAIICAPTVAFALTPVNYFYPYERILKTENWEGSFFRFSASIEDGDTRHGRNGLQDKVNVLDIWDPTQSSIAMLMGAPQGSPINAFANSLLASLGSATDDGFRGRFLVKGEFEELQVSLNAQFRLPATVILGYLDFGLYVPIKTMSVSNVQWTDLTQNKIIADEVVMQDLTGMIDQVALDLGGLHIRDWEKTGFGDIAIIAKWNRDFLQHGHSFHRVRLGFYGGVSFPSGSKKDENEALSFPLGNDHAWGIPLGVNLDLEFSTYVRSGIEVQYLALFDQTGVRRMKTDANQTSFLLLNKGNVTKSFGPFWRFTFYLQPQNFISGVSVLAAYQFTKHDNDTLYPQTDQFNTKVVNTDSMLEEWNIHNLVLQANFDATDAFRKWPVKPTFAFFYKLGLGGKRSITGDTIGGQIGINF